MPVVLDAPAMERKANQSISAVGMAILADKIPGAPSLTHFTVALTEHEYSEYLKALLAGDRARCTAIAQGLLDRGVDARDLYLYLFQRALYEVGSLWEEHKVSVAVEHLATAITERLLTLAHSQIFSGPRRQRSVLIACAPGEHHQLGGRMVADLFEMHGWQGDFLGASLPASDLVDMITARKPDMVGLSVSLDCNLPAMLAAVDEITSSHPDLPILVGGQAFRDGASESLKPYPNVTWVSSIEQLERTISAK